MHVLRTLKPLLVLSLSLALPLGAACGGSGTTPGQPPGEPPLGTTDFVSASGQAGQASQRGEGDYADGAAPAANASEGGDQRTVEEGDIYRVLGPGRLLNLNSYRGLQVIDIADVHAPRVMGRVAVSGYPVEMYVVGERAFVLLNNWWGYYGNRTDCAVEAYQGGLVLAVDLTDPANPTITGRAQVPGNIVTSRLTRGNGKEALFVAASNWNQTSQTVVRSFAVSAQGQLEERTTLDLGGYVVDVQATPQALLVARYQYDQSSTTSAVAVIDIADPEGTMIEGASVPVTGWIKDKTYLDLHQGVLRVASGGRWTGSGTNHLETFNVTDIQNPVAIDHKTFGQGQDLYATIFVENKAFCVTYQRVDPFHAFAIADDGAITEKAEYIISGWNDYFKPVLGLTRLIGIGIDDQNGRAMAASLYDITDLSNPNPFVGRASVEFDYSWSEAQWDDRAFSVLEDAVAVVGPGGVVETGLVLLPFTGYNNAQSSYVAGVQVFTFSATTLTKRGLMDHGTTVQRSFLAGAGLAANLSQEALSLFDTTNPDAPALLGKLDLAPNYMDFFIFGGYGARLKYDRDYYGWWGTATTELPDNQLEIIGLTGDPDNATPLAVVPVPADAQVFQVGTLAITVATHYVGNADPNQPQYSSDVQVIDLSDPLSPQVRSAFTTDRIQPSYGYWYGGGGGPGGSPVGDCWDCGGYSWYYGSLEAQVAGQALVFPSRQWNSELLGMEHLCYSYPVNSGDCWATSTGPEAGCSYIYGAITCSRLNGGPETCSGGFERCTYGDDAAWTCGELPTGSVQTQTQCYDQEKRRYWSYLTLDAIDLRNPDAPVMAPVVTMPEDEDDTGVLSAGTAVYVTYRVPVEIPGDSRPYVRYYFKKIDFANPGSPAPGPGINVPGELLQVDGATVYTRDFVWGESIVETAVNKLEVIGPSAYLRARHRFVDREVHNVVLDGAGHALVTHALPYSVIYQPGFDYSSIVERLSILDLARADMPTLSELDVDQWAQFRDAKLGRALFSVPGGVLVINFESVTAPYAQAYYPLMGWPTRLVVANRDIFIPAGPYGMYRFDLDSFNLLTN